MATEQLHSKLPLALTIPSSLAPPPPPPPPSQHQQQPAPPALAPKPAAPATTPSGMHSPPLSNTVEEEDIEMNTAAAATYPPRIQVSTAKPSTPPTASSSPTKPTSLYSSSSTSSHTTTTTTVTDELPHATAHIKSEDTTITTPFNHSTLDARKSDLQLQQYNKEKAIKHVLEQGKILKVSRRLRTRLEYAILKIRRGWSKYTLNEVESLIKPACSPRFTPGQIQKSLSRQSSPRLAERKRVTKTSDMTSLDTDQSHDVEMTFRPSAPGVPSRFRARMPSLSQFKDSELYLPAKSLMEIASSRPEPGFLSPYLGAQSLPSHGHHSPYSSRHATPEPLFLDSTPVRDTHPQGHRSGHSTPAAPSTPVQQTSDSFDDEPMSENSAPSAAQAARTILMLSSPTRPSPRALNQNYIVEMHAGHPTHSPLGEWTTQYSPMTSSPLGHFQMTASSTPSPDKTPTMTPQPAPSFIGEDRNSNANQKNPLFHTPKSTKQSYSGLYGTGHEPSAPSPLSTSLFPSSNETTERGIKSQSRSSSPTLKRAVRFAAAATNASELKLPVDSMAGHSGRAEYNNTMDTIYPGWQPGHDDKKELSYDAGSHGEGYLSGYNNRAITPPPPSTFVSSGVASHGMRTPPPSGGQDLNLSHYAVASKRRRDSDTPPVGMTDLPMIYRQGPSHTTRPGSFTHH